MGDQEDGHVGGTSQEADYVGWTAVHSRGEESGSLSLGPETNS